MARIALFSPSVLSSAAAGRRLPTLEVALAFAAACGGDGAEWRQRWYTAAGVAGRTAPHAGVRAGARAMAAPAEPASPRQPRPAQLPVGPQFVGRLAELSEARALVAAHRPLRRPLVISGPIGVGKTAFALRLADELSADLPDGQLYADLRGDGGGPAPADVVTGFLGALGVPASRLPAGGDQRIALCRSLLAQRRVLLLLDDAQDERQVRPLLAQTAHSQIVVTSRSRLLGLDGASRQQLDVLPRADSVAMIGAVAGLDSSTEPDLLARLAELCADLPLALAVVARKIAARPGWPVAYTAGQLAAPDQLLDRLRVGDLSVRGRLAAAYRRQRPLARAVFRQLGAARGGHVGAEAVAARWALPIEAAEDLLEALLDAGLLQRASAAGRYRLPPLFRLFAADQPAGSVFDAEPAEPREPGCPGGGDHQAPAGHHWSGVWVPVQSVAIGCSARSILPVNAAPGFDDFRSAPDGTRSP